jgi:hypothetical protein
VGVLRRLKTECKDVDLRLEKINLGRYTAKTPSKKGEGEMEIKVWSSSFNSV